MYERAAAPAVKQAAGMLNIRFIAGLRSSRSTEAARALQMKATKKKTMPSLNCEELDD